MSKEKDRRDILHWPDLHFAKWCEHHFAVNRGVYNTIDEKLFEAGYYRVEQRRRAIIIFLEKHAQPIEGIKFYKFGPGNLSAALSQFSHH